LMGIVLSHFSYIPMIIRYNAKHSLLDPVKELLLFLVVPVGLMPGDLLTKAAIYFR
jgi:hypothetical protein